jgi:diguanylate cyclase (GGDEF)-like protein/PAS domain S-box-containing protein
MESGGQDTVAIDAAYDWLTARHPAAPIAAVGSDGLMVPMPHGLAHDGRVVLKGRSTLDFVEPGDRVVIVAAWERARRGGVSRAPARLVSGEAAYVHFFDLRHRCGTFVAVFGPAEDAAADGAGLLEGHADRSLVPPRVCRLRRDEVAVVVEIDEAVTALLGWRADELVGARSIELVHADDVERAIANWMEMLAVPSRPHRWRGRYRCSDGSYLWLDISNTNRLEDPVHNDVLSEMVDVSDEMSMHEALRERERLLRRLTEALPSGILQFDADRRVIHANEQLAAIVEPSIEGLLDAVVDADRPTLAAALAALLGDGVDTDLEVRLVGERVCRIALRTLTDDVGFVSGGLACVDDVTEASLLRQQLELKATFDGLTACFSRTAILAALEEVASSGTGTGVVFIDLDRFKEINDELGHGAGDELLGAVGERLRRSVRDVDLVGRLGGDEFLVVCPSVDRRALAGIARRLADAIAEPLVLCGAHPIRPHASLGTGWAAGGAAADAAALVAEADAAMYAAKHAMRRHSAEPTL